MKRILIIGCSGSGKSTMSRELTKRLSLPCVHLDQLYWKPNWVKSDSEEFDAKLQVELEKDEWILDGNFDRTLALRMRYADTVILFNYPRLLCLWRVWKRVRHYRGTTRPDMTDGCEERFDLAFMKYIWNFRKKSLSNIRAALAEAGHLRFIEIKNKKQLKAFYDSLPSNA
jgi:adenylate kinase family enzyme